MKGIRVGNKSCHGRKAYASGGRVQEDISDPGSLPVMGGSSEDDGMGVDGGRAKSRLDRAGKKASPVNVNVIVSSSKPEPAAPPMPPPAPPMAGPPPPPPMPAPGLPMRASGGRVNASGQSSKTEKAAERRVTKRADGGAVRDILEGVALGAAPAAARSGLALGKKAANSEVGDLVRKGAKYLTPGGVASEAISRVGKFAAPKLERKHGGRVMEGGAGGGLGRLEKAKDYGAKPAKGK